MNAFDNKAADSLFFSWNFSRGYEARRFSLKESGTSLAFFFTRPYHPFHACFPTRPPLHRPFAFATTKHLSKWPIEKKKYRLLADYR